jgi:hypothetical protein
MEIISSETKKRVSQGKEQAGKDKAPKLNPIQLRKVRNAGKYISKSDSLLEFCYDDPSTGEMAGFLTRLVEPRNHVVLTATPKNFLGIRQEAMAEYELVTSPEAAEIKDFSSLIVTKGNPKNISALLEFLKPLEKAPKLVIWECSNNEENQEIHKELHRVCKKLGMSPSMLGYENVYHREDVVILDLKEGKPQIIPNPPPPRLLHMFIAASVIAFIAFTVWYMARYFFKSMTPTTKSLANNPT